jgi:ABC-type amino acid transport substrate-binding protein
MRNESRIYKISLVTALFALVIAGWAVLRPVGTTTPANTVPIAAFSPLFEAMDAGTIVVGYGVYPPYTVENPNTGVVTGFSIDLINGIASQLNIKVVWKKFNWSTMAADLKRGEIDVIAEPVFETIPRAREFSFTQPYAFVPTGIGIIRSDQKPYPTFDALNDPSVTVAVGQGLAAETLLRTRVPKANIIAVPVANDSTAAANMVLTGRADIAILNLSDAKRFLDANPGKLQGLWIDNPPAFMPAGFALRLGDTLGVAFFNAAIESLKHDGTLAALAKRHGIEADFRALIDSAR